MIDLERIKETKIEDIIITISLYANKIEREYLKTNNQLYKDKYRNLLFIIFATATLVYLYYTISGYNDFKKNQDAETKRLSELSVIASTLVLISGIIYLYIIYKDKDINVELAFN